MKYACFGYREPRALERLSDNDRKALLDENTTYLTTLRQRGHFLDGNVLQGVETAATVRSDNGKISVTDGPFAETKEQLGGVILLEAIDLNHAIQLMSEMPTMRAGGSIEIRPINEHSGCQPK